MFGQDAQIQTLRISKRCLVRVYRCNETLETNSADKTLRICGDTDSAQMTLKKRVDHCLSTSPFGIMHDEGCSGLHLPLSASCQVTSEQGPHNTNRT